MQQQNEYRTTFIRFPTVTKLQYPSELPPDKSLRSTLSFRQNFIRRAEVKLDLIRAAESFKIVNLPQRNEIINICTMTVKGKDRSPSPSSEREQKMLIRKKIFSVTKLNTFGKPVEQSNRPGEEPGEEGSKIKLEVKMRSASNRDIRKLSLPPTITFDYFQVYPQVARLLALSFGVFAVGSEGVQRIRKAKIDLSNNGLMIKHTIKKRNWWGIITDDNPKGKEDIQVKMNLIWTPQIITQRQLERIMENNQACFMITGDKSQEGKPFQRSFDKVLAQLPKIKQLLFTEWEEEPIRFKEWLSKVQRGEGVRPFPPAVQLIPDELLLTNHLPNHTEITNKKLLYKNMVNYYNKININPNCRLPVTHHITCFNWQTVLNQLRSEEKAWILKPGEFTNRGNGISIFRSTKEALDSILHNPPKNEERSYLLQQYISPLLYQQRKFDIRCYMLGVEVGSCLKFFWYEQGYIRTASEKFTTRKVSKGIHLTNDAVQKHLPNYDKHEPANKLSYSELHKYCINNTPFDFYQEILPEMKKIAKDIAHAVGDERLVGSGRGASFQVFGLDFLVDSGGKPWLCEVNTNPSLEICSSLLSRIIPELIQNTFRLVVDILLPPKKTPEYAQNFLTTNKYSLIYSNFSIKE